MSDPDKGETLYLVRLCAHEYKGLEPEPNTRRGIEYDRMEFSALKLAQQLMAGSLRKFNAQLQEFDDPVLVTVLVDRYTAETLSDWLRVVDNYSYSPYGPGASGFGWHSHTCAWLIPNQQYPAIFWRYREEESEANVMYWIDFYQQQIESGQVDPKTMEWPKPNHENVQLEVPAVYSDPKYFRRHAIKSRNLRRIT